MRHKKVISGIVLAVALLGNSERASAETNFPYSLEKLADAIFIAEGGVKTSHPYGILDKYKHTTPRQACINTIKHKYKDWVSEGSHGDFLAYLQSKYAPRHVLNDPHDLNKNWLSNVRRLYGVS